MINFILGVAASVLANVASKLAGITWPHVYDRAFYRGIQIGGAWEIIETRNGEQVAVGQIELEQWGHHINGTGERRLSREGKPSDRKFSYTGRFAGEQLTLIFQDTRGPDFDCGTYVFRVMNSGIEMVGKATFHGKNENKVVSEDRLLRKKPR
jgi:hypothetical protein